MAGCANKRKWLLEKGWCLRFKDAKSFIKTCPYYFRNFKNLQPNSTILDVGCGPTCAGQLFDVGLKTYLDPLMASYLLKYHDKLPDGEKICSAAEQIPFHDYRFDVLLFINALDHMLNPSKALSEMNRVLKRKGVFILGIFLHPAPIGFARSIIEKCLPFFREEAHPYSYTFNSIREELCKIIPH